MHNFTLHGMKWFFEPFNKESGYRNSQFVILSEHYEMLFKMPRVGPNEKTADYVYNPSASFEGLVNGTWGLLRSYKSNAENLARLPNNPAPPAAAPPITVPPGTPHCSGNSVEQLAPQPPCLRTFYVAAVSARRAFKNQNGLVYNSRGARTAANGPSQNGNNPLNDPDALVYVLEDDKGNLLPPKNPEPGAARQCRRLDPGEANEPPGP